MALQSQTLIDTVAAQQTISLLNPSQIDQIIYSKNSFTLPQVPAYSLSRSDFALFYTYLSSYYNALFINFPNIVSNTQIRFPVSSFQISLLGPNMIQYSQTSGSSHDNNVWSINFNHSASQAEFSARSSPITITTQEFFQMMTMLVNYSSQISLV